MNILEALEIVGALADGCDPFTGQPLAVDHLCQQPQVVRALYVVVERVRRTEMSTRLTGSRLQNAGKPWTAAEEAELIKEFEAGAKISQLADKHGRTRQAIHGRLYRLGKVPAWQ